MKIALKVAQKNSSPEAIFYLIEKKSQLSKLPFDSKQKKQIKNSFEKNSSFCCIQSEGVSNIVLLLDTDKNAAYHRENYRQAGARCCGMCNDASWESVQIANSGSLSDGHLLFAEGMALASYQFLKYKKDAKKDQNSLKSILFDKDSTDKKSISSLANVLEAVYQARDLVNEPLSYLTAPQMAKEFQRMGKEAGFKVTVWNKKRIEKENFQGLLAVNKGSVDPPTFTIMEYKPAKAVNKSPIVLVGKGIVYDTGGLSLKSTANSMDHMKCDMGGAAAVAGAMFAIAKNKLKVHVVALVPATDNRPGLNAYVPGDIVRMRDGLSVEVLNTDAEGRMVLADGLSWAKNYKPELVIDLATLTGAALRTVGPTGIAAMEKDSGKHLDQLRTSGENVYERLFEMPLWREYGEMIKSEIADIRNLGGPFAGAQTAGKFLEHFTDFPWIHLDIAPVAWSYHSEGYRLKNGTGAGVRLLFDFLSNR